MTHSTPSKVQTQSLTNAQKLQVIFRVEPGSLGPEGKDHIESYCQEAQSLFTDIDADIARWAIIPRYDKSLPELEYQLQSQRLSAEQAERYLSALGKHINELEEHLEEHIAESIESFLGRNTSH